MAKEKRQRVVMPQLVKSEEAAGSGAGGGGRGEVGSLVDSSQADDRRLIQLVRARRLLYARNNMPVASYYTQVKCLWDDVAKEMGWSVADVRRKWSHIRNSYSRHLRNELHGACTSKGRMVSRWYLADELDFLREHMATDITAKSRKTNAEYQKAYREREKAKKNKNKQESTAKPRKTKAEYQKEYRERQKAKKKENKQESTVKRPKTNAEHQKAFRERQKMKKIKNKRERKKIKLIDTQNLTNKKFIMRHNEILTDHIESSKELRPSPYSSYAPSFLEMDLNDASPPEPDVKPFLHNPWFALGALKSEPGAERAPPSVTTDDSCSSAAFAPDETSSYFQFFRGIHADYQELSARGQRQFKRRCFGLLHELLDEEEAVAHSSAPPGALNLSHSAGAPDSDEDRKPVLDGLNIVPHS